MRSIKFLLSLFLIAILTACIPGSSPTVPPEDIEKALNEIRTEIAQTMLAEIAKGATSTIAPELPTIAPTNTTEPTEPPAPTSTTIPISTSIPTSTTIPTSTVVVLPTQIPATPTATATTAPKPLITIIAIEKNTAVTVQTENFPANQVFKIRVGPFESFFKDYVEVGTINSGSGGVFKFTVLLPATVKDVERVTVRLDSANGQFAYNYFKNVTSGTIPVVTTPVTSSLCQVSVSPAVSTVMSPGYDFDVVWTVKNTSGKTWEIGTIDYKYIRGTEMHKYEKHYDLNEVVKSGDTVKIRVDIMAPLSAGTYTTNWALVKGSTILCNLPLTIIVK